MIITWVVVKESAPVSITLLTNTYRGVGMSRILVGTRLRGGSCLTFMIGIYTVKKIDHSLKHVKTNLRFFGLS